ncbi:allatostatin-A receptor-like [Apostichopus japonicus]|uniref:allatostatin-A receptor-like n=1 Tax=Stichopus japonicus TaxID=307972 RepID=UPI003AB3A5A7
MVLSTQNQNTTIVSYTTDHGDVTSGKSVVMDVLFTLIATLGISGNALVLFVFYKVTELRIFTNILIANQSVVDLATSLLLLFTFVPPNIEFQHLHSNHSFLAHFICKVWASEFIYWAVIKISTTNLVFLTLERYFAIVYPLEYRIKAQKRTAVIVCLAAWIIGTSTAAYFPITHYVDGDCECTKVSLSTGASVTIALLAFLSTYVFPLLIMMFVYVSIFCVLRPNKVLSSLTQVTYTASSSESTATRRLTRGRLTRGRKNVLMTMVLVCVVYAICWTPDQVLYLYHNLIKHQDWSLPLHRIAILLAASNVCINPFIYTLKYRSFQRGLKKVFHRFSATRSDTLSTIS